MEKFNLEEALNGKPVLLRDGSKAIVLTRIPDTYKLINGLKVTFPLFGIILDTKGAVDDPYASWKDNGMFATCCTSEYDIVGMWHDLNTQEKIFVEAYAKDLVLIGYDSLNNTTLEVKLIGKTKGKNKGYITQEEGTGVVELLENINVEHWSIKNEPTTEPTKTLDSYRFKPSYGDIYWYMTFDYGKPVVRQGVYQNTSADINRMEHNNCFNDAQELTEALLGLGFKLDQP